MPVYRIESQDGPTRTVSAARVVVLGDDVRFQTSVAAQWRTVDTIPLHRLRRVQRRFNEADGRLRWVDEREVNAAAAALALQDADADADADVDDLPAAPSAAERPSRPAPAAPPLPVVSAADVRCPSCGEQEELHGRRSEGQILLRCLRCGYDGPRVAVRRCQTCGGADVVERPRALVERARGTQLSVVGYTTIGLCRVCDADDLARAIEHGGAVLPKDCPPSIRRLCSRCDRAPKARRREPFGSSGRRRGREPAACARR
jgi:Zn ribbon nucleic-acid-binding protein